MKRIYKLLSAVAFVALASCADKYESVFLPAKPDIVAQYEYLKDYDVLKTYIDRNANPNFRLGTGVTVGDLLSKETVFSLVHSNFDEVTANDAMKYGSIVQDDGSMDFTNVRSFVETAKEAGITIYGHTLCWHSEQNNAYLNGLIAPVVIPPEVSSGISEILDFEADELGKTYQMTGNGFAQVENDPAGASGKVLHIGGPANQSHPKIEIALPEGRKLGDYINLILDFRASGSSGLYGQGMRMAINDRSLTGYGSPSGFGCPDGNWGRGLIVLPFATMNLTAAEKELTQFTLIVGSGTGSGDYYIDNIKMQWEVIRSGTAPIADFESNNSGDTYPMSGNGSAVVVNDPAGISGNVLNVGGPANYSYPKFNVTLPDGKKLGDYKTLRMDFYGTGSTGLYGSGMRLAINDVNAAIVYGSPSSFGCPGDGWGRGLIALPLADLNLTGDQKALTEFTLIVGSGTGSGNYYIDNIVLEWEAPSEDIIVEKTSEEKKEILTNALEMWIAGMMEACDGYVRAWDVVNEPMDDENPFNLKGDPSRSDADNFYWQDYLGEDYARVAVRFARQYGGNDSKLFVNDYNLEASDNSNGKCEGLIKMVEYWESDGITKIDGIGTQMHVTYSLNPEMQKRNEDAIIKMYELLAVSGKLIKASILYMGIADENGEVIKTANVSFVQQQSMSEYYNFIVRKYFEIIPDSQQYGITHWNPRDNSDTSVGLWDLNYNRKPTYAGFANGLAGKEVNK
ncbi:MAG: endo-1,4-beta-xylanase [Tannerella sp.]|jgi:GH35 family endo-1,4-beta-xylanase|nr:endo-1,4-beta-xylanase [Tannerella sp.]